MGELPNSKAPRKPTILLAEDSEPLRYAVRRFLELHGFRVIEAVDGAEALALATDQIRNVDLLVTDYRMPRMDGFEVAERLKTERPGLPVLFAAGVGMDAVLDSHPKLLFIRKPFELNALLNRINGLLCSTPESSDSKTILLLEDHPVVMNVLRVVLNLQGFSLVEATTVQQALQCIRQRTTDIDLLIADVGLPDGSGVQVALEFHSLLPKLRIILTSGYPPSMWNDQDAAGLNELPSESVSMLQKPFLPATLLAAVVKLIGPPPRIATAASA
jgi:CheY-like chemotaxis protein